jgi:hypothetical protein
MDTKELSFWDVISEYQIEIPAIQRDYAQGRKKEEDKIAKPFIDDLHKAIKEKKKINLHFVYGKIDEKRLMPLDGQQRLTTLFLLHWFLSLGYANDSIKSILSKLKYETRPSSEDFCMKLVKEGIVYNKDTDITEQITDAKWFFLSWKNDPTISAMLNMLKIIQDKFTEPDEELFKLLTSEDSLVKFHFLPLENFKLEDEIYVKMNARGKPLTEFENFKANFSDLFDEDKKSKLDNEWLDIFWKLELKETVDENEAASINIDNVDEKYFNFLKNITLNFYVETNDIEKNFIQEFDIYTQYKIVYSKDNLSKLSKVLDALQSYDDKEKYFIAFLDEDLTYWDRLRFYALTQFFIAYGKLDDANRESYNRWMRICRNLINNTLINNPEDFYKAIRSIKRLSENIGNLYEFIGNPENKIDAFSKEQCEEEKIKVNLILTHGENWNKQICDIEDHPYFDGQIGFILEISKKDGHYNIKSFSAYSCKLAKLFDEHQDKNDCLFQRALFTYGDYLVTINYSSKTFCNFNSNLRDKTDNWRKVFNDDEKRGYLKELLDNIIVNNIKDSLEEIIKTYPKSTDWKSLFIKNKGIIESCNNYRIADWDGKIALSRSGADGWRRHFELYSFVLFKSKLENQQFSPFTNIGYWPSSDYENSEDRGPCAYIDTWEYKDNNFAIDIRYIPYETPYYAFRFFDRNEIYPIPSEIQKILRSLDFYKNDNNEWICEIYETDFGKIRKKIEQITSILPAKK